MKTPLPSFMLPQKMGGVFKVSFSDLFGVVFSFLWFFFPVVVVLFHVSLLLFICLFVIPSASITTLCSPLHSGEGSGEGAPGLCLSADSHWKFVFLFGFLSFAFLFLSFFLFCLFLCFGFFRLPTLLLLD